MNQQISSSSQGQESQRINNLVKEVRELAISDEINKRTIQSFTQAFHSYKEAMDTLNDSVNGLQSAILKIFEKMEKIENDKRSN
jgi:uncharacterized protein YoxC